MFKGLFQDLVSIVSNVAEVAEDATRVVIAPVKAATEVVKEVAEDIADEFCDEVKKSK
jgi:hypothetical protein